MIEEYVVHSPQQLKSTSLFVCLVNNSVRDLFIFFLFLSFLSFQNSSLLHYIKKIIVTRNMLFVFLEFDPFENFEF